MFRTRARIALSAAALIAVLGACELPPGTGFPPGPTTTSTTSGSGAAACDAAGARLELATARFNAATLAAIQNPSAATTAARQLAQIELNAATAAIGAACS